MLIPVKCFTCGNVLADKYEFYVQQVRERKIKANVDVKQVQYLTKSDITNGAMNKTVEAEVLDELGLKKVCCRRHMLTHVDMV